jgi:signal transduction histidine kinase
MRFMSAISIIDGAAVSSRCCPGIDWVIARGKYQGVAQIVRFNWPFYAAATVVLIVGACLVGALAIPLLIRATLIAAIGGAAFWLIMSLVVAHYIYDRAGIYDGAWIGNTMREKPKQWATFHAGLEEFHEVIRNQFPHSEGSVLDFFDATEMSEPSIRRARQLANAPQSIAADFRALPLRNDELDAAFVFFAAHELRKPESRVRFFQELRRTLAPDGRVVLVEHLRDWPNFFAFGPGCFHFHSRRSWIQTIESAGFTVMQENPLTPFVRIFVLEKSSSVDV